MFTTSKRNIHIRVSRQTAPARVSPIPIVARGRGARDRPTKAGSTGSSPRVGRGGVRAEEGGGEREVGRGVSIRPVIIIYGRNIYGLSFRKLPRDYGSLHGCTRARAQYRGRGSKKTREQERQRLSNEYVLTFNDAPRPRHIRMRVCGSQPEAKFHDPTPKLRFGIGGCARFAYRVSSRLCSSLNGGCVRVHARARARAKFKLDISAGQFGRVLYFRDVNKRPPVCLVSIRRCGFHENSQRCCRMTNSHRRIVTRRYHLA